MAFNLRSGTTVVPDGSITEAKLANNSVSASKLQDNSVIEQKIATDAVSTTKIQDDAVDTTKVTSEVVTGHFFGTEMELSNMGDVLTSVAEFNFNKTATEAEQWKSIAYSAKIKTSNVAEAASFHLFIDGTEYSSQQTFSTSYAVIQDDSIDISALSLGSHLIELKLDNNSPTETSYLGQIDLYLGKK